MQASYARWPAGRARHATVELIARAYRFDHDLAPALLEAPELPSAWREWVTARA